MKLYAKYTAWVYLKSFLIVFFALELFYIGIDLLTNLKDLPASANTQLLYVTFTAMTAISYVLPISLVFGLIIAMINMVRSNELVSFYALGVSKNALIVPPLLISLFITCIYVGLNFTPFAYAYDLQKSITKGDKFGKVARDTFLKFEGKFIYIKELNPLNNEAKKIDIFDINDTDLSTATFVEKANFSNDAWLMQKLSITNLPKTLELGADGLKNSFENNQTALKGFKPKSIQNANSGEKLNLNVLDALDFIMTFGGEGVAINSAKSAFYSLVIHPFFAPILLVIMYFYIPVTGRFFNLALASFLLVLSTLIIWGILFVLIKFSQNATIPAEIGILCPVLLLLFYSLYLIKNQQKTIKD
ncbi:MAG: LptF/LptG family permease [Campylobacter sp.]|nr:LptF/LptG family permease [Campylobacter sp.]